MAASGAAARGQRRDTGTIQRGTRGRRQQQPQHPAEPLDGTAAGLAIGGEQALALALEQSTLQRQARLGEAQQPLAPIPPARHLLDQALAVQGGQNARQALLGDAEQGEQITDGEAGLTGDEVQRAMMGPPQAVLSQQRVDILGELARGEQQQILGEAQLLLAQEQQPGASRGAGALGRLRGLGLDHHDQYSPSPAAPATRARAVSLAPIARLAQNGAMSRRALELTPELMLRAYRAGLFPMAETRRGEKLYWLDPEQRGVLPLDRFHLPRRLARTVRAGAFEVAVDRDFAATVRGCAAPAPGREDTWINHDIERLFLALHALGHAHSVECRAEGRLVGGLYGVAIGGAFFGESMFSRVTDASKVALVHLVARLNLGGYRLLDTQFVTLHLAQFGAVEIPREDYKRRLAEALAAPARWSDATPEALAQAIAALASG